MSKNKINDSNIVNEYSLIDLKETLNDFEYQKIICDTDKLAYLFNIVKDYKERRIQLPSRMFDSYEQLHTFNETKSPYEYERLIERLKKKPDMYEKLAIAKFGYSVGLFEKKDKEIVFDGHNMRVSHVAHIVLKEAFDTNYFKDNKICKEYAFKALADCEYNEDNLIEFTKKIKQYKNEIKSKKR